MSLETMVKGGYPSDVSVEPSLSSEACDIERLASLLDYDPATGALTWREDDRYRLRGERADYAHGRYRFVCFESEVYRAHIIAFFKIHNRLPTQLIDHIDGDGFNNAKDNLRDVTQAENLKNKKLYAKNRSGVPGVILRQSGKKWRAQIGVNGRPKFLGEFSDLDEAIRARRTAEASLGYHANHGRVIEQASKKICPNDVTTLRPLPRRKPVITRIERYFDPVDAESWHELAVWPEHRRATAFGNPLDLTKMEFRILCALISAQGLVVPHKALWARVYRKPFDPESRVVDMHVSRLRKKLEGTNTGIHVNRCVGYRLESKSESLAALTIGNFNPRTFNFGREVAQ